MRCIQVVVGLPGFATDNDFIIREVHTAVELKKVSQLYFGHALEARQLGSCVEVSGLVRVCRAPSLELPRKLCISTYFIVPAWHRQSPLSCCALVRQLLQQIYLQISRHSRDIFQVGQKSTLSCGMVCWPVIALHLVHLEVSLLWTVPGNRSSWTRQLRHCHKDQHLFYHPVATDPNGIQIVK